MNLPELITETVKLLAPALPVFTTAGGKALDKIGEAAGDAVVVGAKNLWALLLPHAKQQPALLEAAQDVASYPGDSDAEGALRLQLRKLLEAKPQLVAELSSLVHQTALQQNFVHNTGAGALVSGGDIKGNVVSIHVSK